MKRERSYRFKQVGVSLAIVFGCALIAYSQIVLPNRYAKSYESRMIEAAYELQDCTNHLANTTKTKLFEAPDVSLEQKEQSITDIKTKIEECRLGLQVFNHESHSLQQLRLSGYTRQYRAAKDVQKHALKTIGQSSDVLTQYDQLATFLGEYFQALELFVAETSQLGQLSNTNELRTQSQRLGEIGNELHAQATTIRQLKPAIGFESIIQPTAMMLDDAATGYDNLAIGYNSGNDAIVAAGFEGIDKAVAEHDANVKNLPFNALQNSYAVKQINALPVKFNDLKSDESY